MVSPSGQSSPQVRHASSAPCSSISTPSSSLALPTRQGVHWPQDSSTKNSRKFSATSQHVALRAEDDDRAAGGDVLEGQRARELGGRHAVPGGAADLHRLGALAADLLQQLGDGDAQRELVDARASAQSPETLKSLGPVDLSRADRLEPVGALGQDAGRPGQRLDVVDDGRAGPGSRCPPGTAGGCAARRGGLRATRSARSPRRRRRRRRPCGSRCRSRSRPCPGRPVPSRPASRRSSSTASRCGAQVGVLAAQVEDALAARRWRRPAMVMPSKTRSA